MNAYGQLKINSNGEVGIAGEPKPGYKFSTAPGSIAHFGSHVYIDPGNDGSPLRFDMYDEQVRFRPYFNNDGRIGSYNYQFYKIYGRTIYQNGSQITSDERMKENIVSVENAIDKINQLRPVKFDFKADTSIMNIKDNKKREAMLSANKNKLGFIAQEVQMILPHVVEYDEDADVYSMSYIEIIPLLTSAIQEQQKVVNNQYVETAELRERISYLEKEIQIIKTNCCTTEKSTLKRGDMEAVDNPTQTQEPELYQNNPNPFTETTEIKYYLPETISKAMMCIYDMNGKQLKCYNINGNGAGFITIDGNELQAGMYMYTFIADGQVVDSKRMVLTN